MATPSPTPLVTAPTPLAPAYPATPPPPLLARFLLQVVVDDDLIEADPLGPDEFDVTAAVLQLELPALRALGDCQDSSDALVAYAPRWIRRWAHAHPYGVCIEAALEAFLLGEGFELASLTKADLDQLRLRYAAPA